MTYLDHAATTPLRPEVAAAMADLHGAGAGDGAVLGNPRAAIRRRSGPRLLEEARDEVAAFVGRDPGDIVFTSVAPSRPTWPFGPPRRPAGPGEAVLLSSAVEHPAVREAAVPRPRPDSIRVSSPSTATASSTRRAGAHAVVEVTIVAIMLANNETGVIQPLPDLIETINRRAPTPTCSPTPCSGALHRPGQVTAAADLVSLSATRSAARRRGRVGISGRSCCSHASTAGAGARAPQRTQDVVGAVGLATALRLVSAERATAALRVAALRTAP